MDDLEESRDTPDNLEDDDEEAGLRDQLFRAKDQLTSLAEGTAGQVEDADLCADLALQVKPYADRLNALHRLLAPIDRLIDKRIKLTGLSEDIAAEVAQLEELSVSLDAMVDPGLLKEIQAELDQARRERKITADLPADTDEPTPPGVRPFGVLPVADRLERIFGKRFVSPERLGLLLKDDPDPTFAAQLNGALEEVWSALFSGPRLAAHAAANRIRTLQRVFRDYALICRVPILPGAHPCTIEQLRQRFRKQFLKVPIPSLWYSKLDFFRQPLAKPHWALLDRQYLNCTFKKPGLRLLVYARANELPLGLVRQKSALEDTYDRVVMNLALGEPFFTNCNSITRTVYQLAGEESSKQVYVFYKGLTICISGRQGLPHWRPGRPRWPGVLPALVFPVA